MKIEPADKRAFLYLAVILLCLAFFLNARESFMDKSAAFILPARDKVSINTAEWYDLIKVPGIGEKTAVKVVEYRNDNGPFKDITGLKNVSGIGPKKFEKIKPYIKL